MDSARVGRKTRPFGGGRGRRRWLAWTAVSVLSLLVLAEYCEAQIPGARRPSRITRTRPGGDDETATLEANEFRPMEGATPQGEIELDFEEAELITVIKAIGAMTGKIFHYDPNQIKGLVSIVAYNKMPADLAYEVLELVLNDRGFILVESLDGNIVKIEQSGQAAQNIPLTKDRNIQPEGYDRLHTYVIALRYANATDLQSILQHLGSQSATVQVYATTNTLIITDVADGIRRMLSFLEDVDVPGQDADVEIFLLNFTRAEVLATQIMEVLDVEGGEVTPPTAPARRRPSPRVARPNIPGTQESIVAGSTVDVLRITPDERLNGLIVVATPPRMDQVRDLIDKLDRPTPWEQKTMWHHPLLNADAEEVEAALQELVGGTQPREAAASQGGGGAAPTGEVQPFAKKVSISRYDPTNSLLIIAAPEDYNVLKEFIAQLDVPPRQVLVEAIIMDVTIRDEFTLEVQTAAIGGNDVIGLNNTVTLAEIVSGGQLGLGVLEQAGGSGASVGVLDGTTTISVPDPANPGQFVDLTVPKVPLFIKAVETLTDADILSKPSLITVDNEESNIIVGQEVPFITGSQRALNQTATVTSSVYNRVDRKDVGIKMKVTPQITEGDNVSLELDVEVSDTIASSVGADVNTLGPTFSKSQVQTLVSVKNGSTAILGGLISENMSRTITQAPILGDIPIIGALFRNRNTPRRKQNLVLLVTPNIVKASTDHERVTEYKMGEFENANVDVLFERGFIRKIKRKHQMRKHYRPSTAVREKLSRGHGFGRGDIER